MKTCLGLSQTDTRPLTIEEVEWLAAAQESAKRKLFYLRVGAWAASLLLFFSMLIAVSPLEAVGFIICFTMLFLGPLLILKARDAKKDFARMARACKAREALVFQGALAYEYLVPQNRQFFKNIGIQGVPDEPVEICCLEESGVIVSTNGVTPKIPTHVAIGLLGAADPQTNPEFPGRITELSIESDRPTRPLSESEINEIQNLVDGVKWYRPYWVPILFVYMASQFFYALSRPAGIERVIFAGLFGAITIGYVLRFIRCIQFTNELKKDMSARAVSIAYANGNKYEILPASRRIWTVDDRPVSNRHVWAGLFPPTKNKRA